MSVTSLARSVARSSGGGFLYGAGGFTTIDYPGAVGSQANGINLQGAIVGSYNQGGPSHGYLYEGGFFTTIDVPGSSYTFLSGINDLGIVVGQYRASVLTGVVGFLDNGGVFTTITISSALITTVNGINNQGDFVGTYWDSNLQQHGFIGSGTTLSTLDFPGASHTQARGINHSGQIVGLFQDTGGIVHGYIATPVPEPTPFSVISLITISLLGIRTRTFLFAHRPTFSAGWAAQLLLETVGRLVRWRFST